MNRWFRFYAETLNNRKAQSLPDALFKHWVNILCIACSFGGVLPSAEDVAFGLRVSVSKAESIVTDLFRRKLLDKVEGGYYRPHDWDMRQYKSDVSNERVKRYRERQSNVPGNVTRNVTETPSDTEPDSETEKRSGFGIVEGGQAGKGRQPPRHLAVSRERKRVFVRKDTPEWDQYASDFKSHRGVQPEPDQYGGVGRWFNIAGEQPVPKRA